MEWLVHLEGHRLDLEELLNWFSRFDHKIKMEDRKYYLVSSALYHCCYSREVVNLAKQIVERINGASKAFEQGFRPVQIGSEVVQVHDDGSRKNHHHMEVVEKVRAKASFTASGGKPVPLEPSRPEKLVARWEVEGHESDLARVLLIGFLPQQTWEHFITCMK
jgi:hypothetical protein